MFCYFDKYIYQFEQIHFAIWTNTLVIWRNTFGKLDKNILQLVQIHFATNILWQTRVQHHAGDQRLLPHLCHPHHFPHDLLPVQSANYLQVGFHHNAFILSAHG